MMKSMYTTQMSHGASAPCANAASSCAQTASMQSAHIAFILDAMIMASIFFFFFSLLGAIRLSALVMLPMISVVLGMNSQ